MNASELIKAYRRVSTEELLDEQFKIMAHLPFGATNDHLAAIDVVLDERRSEPGYD